MRDTLFNQLFGLESSLEGSHVNAWIHLEQVYFFQCHCAIYIASANGQVRETATNYVLFISLILHDRLAHVHWLLLLMDKVDVVLNALYVHFLGVQSSDSWHVDVLRVRLVELVLALLLLNHL